MSHSVDVRPYTRCQFDSDRSASLEKRYQGFSAQPFMRIILRIGFDQLRHNNVVGRRSFGYVPVGVCTRRLDRGTGWSPRADYRQLRWMS